MKNLRLGLTFLIAACLGVRGGSQGTPDGSSPFSGTWRADNVPGWAFGWTVVLKMSGSTTTGAVSNCPRAGAMKVTDATIVDRTVRFKCRSQDGKSVMSFVGTIRADEISFNWELEVGSVSSAEESPQGFIARRVSDALGVVVLDRVAESLRTTRPAFSR